MARHLHLVKPGEPVYAPAPARCRVCREPLVEGGFNGSGEALFFPHRCNGGTDTSPWWLVGLMLGVAAGAGLVRLLT